MSGAVLNFLVLITMKTGFRRFPVGNSVIRANFTVW